MFVSLKRVIKAGWKNISRNPLLAVATVFIIVLVVALATSLFLAKGMAGQLITELESKVDLTVYFKTDTLEKDILNAKDDISNLANVEKVEYVSTGQAMQDFKDRHKNNSIILETLDEIGDNPFQPSLNIKVEEAEQYESLVSYLNSSSFKPLIDQIDYQEKKPVIDKMFSLASWLSIGGIIFSFILAFLAVLVAFNTIRLAIYSSREEIGVQRLVGASNWFIRGPYVFQGALSGLIAAVFCLIVFAVFSFFLSPKLEIVYPTFNLFQYFLHNFFLIFGIQLLTGVGLGVISSIVAIRKYLRI